MREKQPPNANYPMYNGLVRNNANAITAISLVQQDHKIRLCWFAKGSVIGVRWVNGSTEVVLHLTTGGTETIYLDPEDSQEARVQQVWRLADWLVG